jgi:hypothetical protein
VENWGSSHDLNNGHKKAQKECHCAAQAEAQLISLPAALREAPWAESSVFGVQ